MPASCLLRSVRSSFRPKVLSTLVSLALLLSHPLVSLLAVPNGAADNELNVGVPALPSPSAEPLWSDSLPESFCAETYPGKRPYDHGLLVVCADLKACLAASEYIQAMRASAPPEGEWAPPSAWAEGEYSYIPDVTIDLVSEECLRGIPALVVLILRSASEGRFLTPSRSTLAPKQGNSEHLWLYSQALRYRPLPRPLGARDMLFSHWAAFSAFRFLERVGYAVSEVFAGTLAVWPPRWPRYWLPTRDSLGEFQRAYTAFAGADVSSLNPLAVLVYDSFSMLRTLTSSLRFRAGSDRLKSLSELASPVLVEYQSLADLRVAINAAAFLAATQQYLPQYGVSTYLHSTGARIVPPAVLLVPSVVVILGWLLLDRVAPPLLLARSIVVSVLSAADPPLAFLLMPGVWLASRRSVAPKALGALALADSFTHLAQARIWVCALLAQEAAAALAPAPLTSRSRKTAGPTGPATPRRRSPARPSRSSCEPGPAS